MMDLQENIVLIIAPFNIINNFLQSQREKREREREWEEKGERIDAPLRSW